MAAVLFVELPSADSETAAATPRRFFCELNHLTRDSRCRASAETIR
jgi:hypothetical protein